jgi:hypothetical protein
MTKQERIDQERAFERQDAHTAAVNRLAAATERAALANEVAAGIRLKGDRTMLPATEDGRGGLVVVLAAEESKP